MVDISKTEVALELQTFESLGFGRENAVLPPVTIPGRTAFVQFPCGSDGLRPYDAPKFDIEIPRFSVFDFDEVLLHGFRLYERDGMLFDDVSLTSDVTRASATLRRMLRRDMPENVMIDEFGRPGSRTAEVVRLDGRGCMILSSDEPSNFGSWIYRFLTKFILSNTYAPVRRVFCYDGAPWMREVLQLVDPSVIIMPQNPEVSYRISNAHIASLPAPHVFFRSELTQVFAEIAARVNVDVDVPERIYVSRRKQAIRRPGFRVLENETELVERLGKLGFVEFFPEDHPIAAQVAIFSRARYVVSLGGSNLFCAAFAQRAEFIVDIESGDEWLYAHMNLLASTDRPFSVVHGVRNDRGDAIHSNWTLDVDSLVAGLRALGVA